MSLACLVCHRVESPSHSFRSYSASSSDNEGRCSAMAKCLIRKASSYQPNISIIMPSSASKVNPHPTVSSNMGQILDVPRLVRSHAVRRDLVRDWNFEEFVHER